MSYEFTDAMSILDMLFEYEESMIWRFHGKNTKQEDYPSDAEVRDQAEAIINGYSNVELLQQMQFVINERQEQRARREKTRLSVQEG